MGEIFHPNIEHLSSPSEVQAGALFVDLDETFLDGTVVNMTDEELENAGLISKTLSVVRKANDLGIPVVMVTRNSMPLINRFFTAKPGLRSLFSETIPCETGQKSEPIKNFLEINNIDPERAIFLDDTSGERDDVKNNSNGTIALDPDNADNINLKTIDIQKKLKEKEVRKKIESLLAFNPRFRHNIVKNLQLPLADANYINLAA